MRGHGLVLRHCKSPDGSHEYQTTMFLSLTPHPLKDQKESFVNSVDEDIWTQRSNEQCIQQEWSEGIAAAHKRQSTPPWVSTEIDKPTTRVSWRASIAGTQSLADAFQQSC